VSTAFVVGNKSGLVFEDEEIVGYFPRKGSWTGATSRSRTSWTTRPGW
jgi:hypothetical protein